jgi:uncharacterized protein with PhoU and TrkA domain
VDVDPDDNVAPERVYALFFLVSPENDQNAHLRTLATLASRTDEDAFLVDWRAANDEQELKEALIHHERYLTLHLLTGTSTEGFIDERVRDLQFPAGNLVALIRRRGNIIIPSGSTTLEEGDRLTIIGDPAGIQRIYELHRKGEREGVVQ